ncbi:MAG: maleylpyruvate isomerase family mycothiol-dependent enzyme [Nocardioides sp.]|uniref:maleylpyruvate isomerase family mycothiol-dependent enzyme n=1 Tax=Nocardioides sp. TaxID=35761 RepID=UPI003D6B5621
MDVAARTAANRHLLADFFDGLDESQLAAQSLCSAWTVREVLGHSAMPFSVGIARLLWRTLRAGGSIDRAAAAIAAEQARRPVPELTGLLRTYAGKRVPAPGVGPMGQFTDHCIHLRDCARPLGLDADVSLADWREVLDWLPSKQAALGVAPAGRIDGLALRAHDQDWSWGSGAEVAGPSEAIAMALAGRSVALADLSGPGVTTLRERIA